MSDAEHEIGHASPHRHRLRLPLSAADRARVGHSPSTQDDRGAVERDLP
jgi:hypothetical protein